MEGKNISIAIKIVKFGVLGVASDSYEQEFVILWSKEIKKKSLLSSLLSRCSLSSAANFLHV